jgi:hypothetical protein
MPHQRFDPRRVDIDAIEWDEAGPAGVRYAQLAGHRDVPGEPFGFAMYLPTGFVDRPHSHDTELLAIVRRGRMRAGVGMPSPDGAAEVGVGSGMRVPAGVPHYGEALDDTILVCRSTGPWRTTVHDTGGD